MGMNASDFDILKQAAEEGQNTTTTEQTTTEQQTQQTSTETQTQTTETQTETQAATETSQETATQTSTEQQTTETKPALDLNYINEKLGSQFKDINEFELTFKELYGKRESLTTLDEKLKAIEAKENYLKDSMDVMKYFDSETDFKISQLKKTHPEWDKTITSKLNDLDNLSDVDVLRLKVRLGNQRVKSDEIADEFLRLEFNGQFDPTTEDGELTPAQLAFRGSEADKFRAQLKGELDNIKLPETIDLDARINEANTQKAQQLEAVTKGWEPILAEIKKGTENVATKMTLPGTDFDFTIDEQGRSEIANMMADVAKNSLLEVNADNYRQAMNIAYDSYFLTHKDTILKSYEQHITEKVNKIWEEKAKGTPPVRKDNAGAPAQTSEDEAIDKIVNNFNNGFKIQ